MGNYGIDLELFTFDKKGEVEEGVILLQLKASDRLRLRSGQGTFRFRGQRRDLARWLAESMPVLLIVYDARKEAAYWLYLQSYFRRREGFNLFTAGKTVPVTVPTANVVNTASMRRFAHFRDRVLAQLQELTHDEE